MGSLLSELKRRKVIRVAGLYILGTWVVLQVADLAFESWSIPSEALRFVWIGAVLGFPVAMFLGWRFDIIGGRIVRTPDSGGDSQPSLERTDYLILTILAVVTVAITAVLLSELSLTRSSPTEQVQAVNVDPRSIAVLPFQDMSASQDREYFGDGIAEELLNRLAKVEDFRVAGRTSSFSFKDQPDDLRAIGEKLNVAVVLEGSVRTSGDQVRITAQLINTADGFHLWSETYDRKMDNVFAIQDEIAGSVVNAVLTTLDGEAETPDLAPVAVANSDAYVLYLKGRHLLRKRTGEIEQAQNLFAQAISIDPDYAPAYAGQALAMVLGPDEEMIPQAERAISRALTLDPGNSEALTTMGLLRQLQGRQEEAREALQQAIVSNPNNALAHTWLGRSYAVSDPAKYLELVRSAYRIDPLDPTTLFHLSVASRHSGHYNEALVAAGERHALDPESGMGIWLAGEAHHASGRLDKAIKTYYHAYLMAPDSPGSPVPREFMALKEIELAKAWRRAAKRVAPESVSIADATLALLDGDAEEAFRLWSQQASYDQEIGWGHLIYSGDLDSARQAYEQYLLKSGQSTPRFDPDDWLHYADYALTLQRTGAPERAQELIDEAIALVESQLATGVVLAPYTGIELRVVLSALYAMSGDEYQAIGELRRFAKGSEVLLYPWALRHWPHWEDLRDHPEFESFVSEQEANLAEVRERLAYEGMLLTPEEVLQLKDFSFDPFLIE